MTSSRAGGWLHFHLECSDAIIHLNFIRTQCATKNGNHIDFTQPWAVTGPLIAKGNPIVLPIGKIASYHLGEYKITIDVQIGLPLRSIQLLKDRQWSS